MSVRACICDEHLELSDDGVLCVRSGAFGPRLVLRYTASAQFRKASYPWLSKVYARVQAGGGGSGSAPPTGAGETAAGGGGGGGGYAEALVDVASLADVELVQVGAGGGVTAFRGEDGGDSAFGNHAMATGGGGGSGPGAANSGTHLATSVLGLPGSAGSGTVGDVLVTGGSGGYGWSLGSVQIKKGGRGGNTRFGGGRAGRTTQGAGLSGHPGTGEGAGGAVAGSGTGATLRGGDGGSGVVVLELYG